MASPRAFSAPLEVSTAAGTTQGPGKYSVLGGQPQLVLQHFLGGSWEPADLRPVVVGHSILKVFFRVAIDSNLVHELNLH